MLSQGESYPMKETAKITGLIIAKNEEKNIAGVLTSMDFCDEIIVVDSFSTDKTIEIASQFRNVTVIEHDFEDFTKQRNFALECAHHDWILFLDGDERITPALKAEIVETVNSSKAKDAYYIYRTFFVGQKKINFSGTQSDKNFRLFRKSKASYLVTKKVHETLEVHGSIGILKNKLLHYSFDNFEQFKKKMLQYGHLKGQELAGKEEHYSHLLHWSKVAFKFIKTYFIKLGFLDGADGLKISYLQSLYVNETYKTLKICEKTV